MKNKINNADKGRKGWSSKAIIIIAAILCLFLAVHTVVIVSGGSGFLKIKRIDEKTVSGIPATKTDCILILGAGLKNGSPSPMLRERLDMGAALYFSGASDKILLTGDNGRSDYDEVSAMEKYLVEESGVPGNAIVKDHAGFSTYESMARAKKVFCVKSAVIVTQKYHLYRAVYIASHLGIEAYGADAQVTTYTGRYYREARECIARVKDFFSCLFKPDPKYLGEKIPINEKN